MTYWALKTRRDKDGTQKNLEDYWEDFNKAKEVIAIGWGKIEILPTKDTTTADIIKALKNTDDYSNKNPSLAASTIYNFLQLTKDDNILICRGYSPNQKKDVRLYGTACYLGDFYDHRNSDWWRFKHKANIQRFGENGKEIPEELLAEMLDKGSLRLTLQQISKEGFEKVVKWARNGKDIS